MIRRWILVVTAPLLAWPVDAASQTDQTWATYITEEEWQMVNELPGVDRQLVSRDIGELNLSVGIIHRGSTREQSNQGGGGGGGNRPPGESCGVNSSDRDSGGVGHPAPAPDRDVSDRVRIRYARHGW